MTRRPSFRARRQRAARRAELAEMALGLSMIAGSVAFLAFYLIHFSH